MSVTRTIALRYMKTQKRRTVLTIFGVVMAVALVSAIGLFLSSIMGMLRTDTEYHEGSHHFSIQGLTVEEQEELAASPHIAETGRLRENTLAFAALEEGGYRHILIQERDIDAFDLVKVELIEGRLPENAEECILSERAWQILSPRPEVGESITLPTGENPTDGSAPEITGSRTFTVTGIYEYSYGGRLLTVMDRPEDSELLVRVTGFGDKHKLMERALEETGLPISYTPNSSYLRSTFESGTPGMRLAFSTTFLLLAIIILAAMVLVIRNSFAMSMSEKITQFGILRCVGASPKQIRSVMYTEAMTIWCIGLPLGLLCGLLAMAIVFAIVNNIDLEMLKYLTLVVEWWPFIITAVLSFLAVILSARAPARKASRISPIEAVRGSVIYRESGTSRKTRRTVRKPLFGFPGLIAGRNIRRNKKRYRVTVMSIVVSMSLFMGLTSFAVSFAEAAGTIGGLEGADYSARCSKADRDAVAQLNAAFATEPDILERKAMVYSSSMYLLNHEEGNCGLETVWLMSVDEEAYSQIELSKGAPSYKELVASGGAALCQTIIAGDPDTGLQYIPTAEWKAGDTLKLQDRVEDYVYDEEKDTYEVVTLAASEFSLRIDTIVELPPWYANTSAILCILPVETAEKLLYPESFTAAFASMYIEEEAPVNVLENGNPQIYLKARDGKEEDLSRRAGEIIREFCLEDKLNTVDIYREYKEVRNMVAVVNIFVYGFMAVVVLICLVNICNTVSTNIHARARELAMLRATGMTRRQFSKMLFLECLLYSLGGAVIGGLIGYLIYLALVFTMGFAFDLRSSNTLRYLIYGFLGTIAVAYISGWIPLRGRMKKPIVEDIRAAE